jgi:hypothetical protein
MFKAIAILSTATLVLAFMPKDANARDLTNAQSSVVANGIATHGAIVCNPAWMDRPGAYAILNAATLAAHGMSKGQLRTLIMRGMTDFDNSVSELGKAGACQKLNAALVQMGG